MHVSIRSRSLNALAKRWVLFRVIENDDFVWDLSSGGRVALKLNAITVALQSAEQRELNHFSSFQLGSRLPAGSLWYLPVKLEFYWVMETDSGPACKWDAVNHVNMSRLPRALGTWWTRKAPEPKPVPVKGIASWIPRIKYSNLCSKAELEWLHRVVVTYSLCILHTKVNCQRCRCYLEKSGKELSFPSWLVISLYAL